MRLFSTLGFLSLLQVHTAMGDDLATVYSLAQQQDPQLQAAMHQKNAAREAIDQSRAAYLPEAGITLDRSQIRQHTLDRDKYGMSGQALNLKVPVFHWDRWVGMRQADRQVQQAELVYAGKEQDLIMRVSQAYFNILSAEEELKLAVAEKKAMEKQLATTQERLKVGEVLITDVQEAQSWYDLSAARVIASENQLDSRKESLAEIIGTSPEHLKPLKADIPLEKPNPDKLDTWVEASLHNNPSLQAAKISVAIADDQVEKVRAGHLPTVDILGSRSYQDSNGSTFWQGGTRETDALMVQMNIPLYAGGMVSSRERQAVQTAKQSRQEVEVAQRAMGRQTRDAFRAVVSGIAQIHALKQATLSASSALAATRAGQLAGSRTTLDVLTSEREYYQAQRNLANARYQYVLAALQLKQLAGSLSIEDLNRINNWLK